LYYQGLSDAQTQFSLNSRRTGLFDSRIRKANGLIFTSSPAESLATAAPFADRAYLQR
jgi:hypothetical protein